MGNRKKLPHHEELTRQPVMTKNQFTEKKLLRQERACKLLSVNSSQSNPWSGAERSEAKRNGLD
jgi:hypothetical protein